MACARGRCGADADPESAFYVNLTVEGAPDPSPLVRLRVLLTVARRRGEPFDAAWLVAMDSALLGLQRLAREQWEAVMWSTQDAWERAYYRRPARAGERLTALS